MSCPQTPIRDLVEEDGWLYFVLSCGHQQPTFARSDWSNCNPLQRWTVVLGQRRICRECHSGCYGYQCERWS